MEKKKNSALTPVFYNGVMDGELFQTITI